MTVGVGMRSLAGFTARDRRAIFLMVLVAFVAGYGGAQLGHVNVFVRLSYDLTEGGMFSIFGITRLISLLGVGFAIVADRRGRRIPFLVVFALLPLANLATAFAPGVMSFTAAQSVARIAVVTIAALAVVILAEELSPGVRALGLGVYALAHQMGTGTGLILLPIAEQSDGSWRVLFALTGLGLLVVPLVARFLHESRAYVHHQKKVTFAQALRAGLWNHFWPLAGMAFFVAAFAAPAIDFVLERMIDDLGWDAGAARFLLIVFSGAGAVGLLVGGRLADSLGRRPTTVLALAMGLVGGVLFYTQSSGWILAPAIFVASFGISMLTPAFAAHRSELFPTRVRASAAGWVTNAGILGSIAGFTAGALVVDTIGLSATIMWLGGGVVIAMLLVLRLPETKGLDLVRRRAGPERTTTTASQPAPPSAPPAPTTLQTDPNPSE
jgi:MFS family permease